MAILTLLVTLFLSRRRRVVKEITTSNVTQVRYKKSLWWNAELSQGYFDDVTFPPPGEYLAEIDLPDTKGTRK